MLEIRAVEQQPITRTIKTDLEGPKVMPQGSGDPAEATESLYASKSSIRYKNRSKISYSCPVRETRTPRIQAWHASHCSFLLDRMVLDKFQQNWSSKTRVPCKISRKSTWTVEFASFSPRRKSSSLVQTAFNHAHIHSIHNQWTSWAQVHRDLRNIERARRSRLHKTLTFWSLFFGIQNSVMGRLAVRSSPIPLKFTQYITNRVVKVRFSGIYKILNELGGVGCTKR